MTELVQTFGIIVIIAVVLVVGAIIVYFVCKHVFPEAVEDARVTARRTVANAGSVSLEGRRAKEAQDIEDRAEAAKLKSLLLTGQSLTTRCPNQRQPKP